MARNGAAHSPRLGLAGRALNASWLSNMMNNVQDIQAFSQAFQAPTALYRTLEQRPALFLPRTLRSIISLDALPVLRGGGCLCVDGRREYIQLPPPLSLPLSFSRFAGSRYFSHLRLGRRPIPNAYHHAIPWQLPSIAAETAPAHRSPTRHYGRTSGRCLGGPFRALRDSRLWQPPSGCGAVRHSAGRSAAQRKRIVPADIGGECK